MTTELHRLLIRQMKKSNLNLDTIPVEFLNIISKSYYEYDESISMLNRISHINEEELTKRNLQLKESKEKEFESLLQRLPGYVSWIDNDLIYLGTNSNLEKLLELNKDQIIGKRIGEVFPNENLEFGIQIKEFINSSLEESSFEYILATPSNAKNIIVYLQKIESGNKVIIVGIDLTEKIKLQSQIDLARALEVQNAKLVSLGELAAGVGHEINNPLMIISGNVIRIRKDVESIDVITSNLLSLKVDKIENAITRISKILSNLKMLSRNTESDTFEKTYLNKLIESSLELIQHRTLESKIKIISSIDSNLVINCLPPELLQVFYNILNNSIDAISNLDTQWIEINCDQLSDKVLIRFLDSGPGIDQQKISKLFEPFFTTKAPGQGTGLGLSICRNIIEKHNGRIYYNPNITHTCFVIELPII